MRQSNKVAILRGAEQVIREEGVTAVTFDSVAAATGLTRGGIIYHFPSREELIAAIHVHLAAQWEQVIEEECGKSAAEATLHERLVAYIRACGHDAHRAEIAMFVESTTSEHQQPWIDVMTRWTPRRDAEFPENLPDSVWLALLAADGLWFNVATSDPPIDPAVRTRLAEAIVGLLEQ